MCWWWLPVVNSKWQPSWSGRKKKCTARGSPSRSHTLNIAPAPLAERVWCTEFQLSLVNISFPSRWVLPNRSFSHDVTAAIFVYKTMNRRPCLCTKISPVGIELFSQVKTFFYSKQFAKLLTTRLKTKLRRRRQRGRRKSEGLVRKQQLRTCITLFCTFLCCPSLNHYDVKWPNFKFCWGRERQGNYFYNLCLNSGAAPSFQLQHKFPSFK